MSAVQTQVVHYLLSHIQVFGQKGSSITDMRRRIDRGMRWIPQPRGIAVQRVDAGGVPAEWLIPPDAPSDRALLYFHGGGFCICSLDTHRNLVAALARTAGIPALSVDYRMAPEHPFPAAVEDCLAAYRWLISNGITPGKIVLGGDSAGGNLALALLLALRDAGDPLPGGAMLISPVTDLAGTLESRITKANVDVILHGGVTEMVNMYVGEHEPNHPLLSPLFGDLRDLPPLLFHVGTDEILFDDSICFEKKARQVGVDAQVVVWPGMWHVFQVFPFLPEGRQSIQQLGEFIRRISTGENYLEN